MLAAGTSDVDRQLAARILLVLREAALQKARNGGDHLADDLKPGQPRRDGLVAAWLASFEIVGQMIDDITGFLQRWLPQYTQDTRSYLTIAVGCTGGQHRSVYVVEQLAKRFADHDPLLVRHRAQLPDESS